MVLQVCVIKSIDYIIFWGRCPTFFSSLIFRAARTRSTSSQHRWRCLWLRQVWTCKFLTKELDSLQCPILCPLFTLRPHTCKREGGVGGLFNKTMDIKSYFTKWFKDFLEPIINPALLSITFWGPLHTKYNTAKLFKIQIVQKIEIIVKF